MNRDFQRFPDWFSSHENAFRRHLGHLAGTPCQMLQIGAYVGDATDWLVKNILTHEDSFVIDVDPWTGSKEHQNWIDFTEVEQVYEERRVKSWGPAVYKRKMTSDEFFYEYGGSCYEFDFIYIDGDHRAKQALKDGMSAIEELKVGGIIAFDDYLWRTDLPTLERPKAGIDAFLALYADHIEVLEKNYQVWIKKTEELW